MQDQNTPAGIVLLSRAIGCPNCSAVKAVLATKAIHYQQIDVDENPTQAAPFLAKAKSRSLPLLFINGENVAAGLSCVQEIRKYGN